MGRSARVRVREHIEDSAGHEADTLFGSWLDADDRVAHRLERYVRLSQASIAAMREHVATTELMLSELEPDDDDPRGTGR